MNRVLEDVCDALVSLGESVIARAPNKNLLVETQGWNTPSISFQNLADFPKNLAEQIRNANIEELSEDLEESLKDVPRKLQLLTQHTVAQIQSGNGAQGIPAYMATIQWIAALVQPNIYWESIQDPKSMPPMLAKRLSSLKTARRIVNRQRGAAISNSSYTRCVFGSRISSSRSNYT